MPAVIEIPEVPGDPAGMRALASALKGDARDIESVASGLGNAVESMTFKGPAGDRFRTEAQSSSSSLGDCATRLTDLAGFLETKATEVEAAQKARLDRINALRREMAHEGVPVRIEA